LLLEKNKKINVDISTKDGKIYCKIKIPPLSSSFTERLDVDTKLVTEFLKRQGYKLGPVFQEDRISNKSSNSTVCGIWIFSPRPKPASNTKKTTRSVRKPRTTKR
jgi:hypothetical protein